jgi:hypothetical protein
MTTTDERLAVLEHKVDGLCADVSKRLDAIEAAVLSLRLHEARMEPFERGIWIILGVVLAAVGSGLLYILRSGVVPAAR